MTECSIDALYLAKVTRTSFNATLLHVNGALTVWNKRCRLPCEENGRDLLDMEIRFFNDIAAVHTLRSVLGSLTSSHHMHQAKLESSVLTCDKWTQGCAKGSYVYAAIAGQAILVYASRWHSPGGQLVGELRISYPLRLVQLSRTMGLGLIESNC